MMGPHHAATGAAAWLALASHATLQVPESLRHSATWLPESIQLGAGLVPGMTPVQVMASTIFAAGAALLPDIDHHNATIARSLPPITTWTAKAFGSAAGGHRHGTHTLAGVLLFALSSLLMSWWVVDIPALGGSFNIGSAIYSMILVALFLVTFKVISKSSGKLAPWLAASGISLAIGLAAPDTWYWLPMAVTLGSLVHLLGDFLTVGGVPFFKVYWMGKVVLDLTPPPGQYLFIVIKDNGFVSMPILGKTGSGREWAMATLLGAYTIVTFLAVLWQFVVETFPSI